MITKTKKLVISAFFAALICVATMIIKIPSPMFNGYLNFGDCIVLTAGWFLSPVYSFFAASIGSALADIFSGYIFYAPVTFFVKGIMAITAYYVSKTLNLKTNDLISKIVSALIAELIMVLGYYIFEGIIYGFVPSLANALANLIQGTFGMIMGVFLARVFEKNKILM